MSLPALDGTIRNSSPCRQGRGLAAKTQEPGAGGGRATRSRHGDKSTISRFCATKDCPKIRGALPAAECAECDPLEPGAPVQRYPAWAPGPYPRGRWVWESAPFGSIKFYIANGAEKSKSRVPFRRCVGNGGGRRSRKMGWEVENGSRSWAVCAGGRSKLVAGRPQVNPRHVCVWRRWAPQKSNSGVGIGKCTESEGVHAGGQAT